MVSTKNIKQHIFVFYMDNNRKYFLSNKSAYFWCDTEDWSNGCWKIQLCHTGINNILKCIKIENIYIICNNISQYYSFYFSFFVSIQDFKDLKKNILPTPNSWCIVLYCIITFLKK